MSFAADRSIVSRVDRAVKIKMTNAALLRHSKHLPDVSAVPREYGCWDVHGFEYGTVGGVFVCAVAVSERAVNGSVFGARPCLTLILLSCIWIACVRVQC